LPKPSADVLGGSFADLNGDTLYTRHSPKLSTDMAPYVAS